MKPKLLLTGASGFLGWNICRCGKHSWEITGTTFTKTNIKIHGVEIEKTDLTDEVAVEKLVNRLKPDAILHTAAISDANFCQQNAEKAAAINIDATAHLASLAAHFKIPFTFTSTDLVFDGNSAPYDEAATPNPLSIYGKQKVEAERAVLNLFPQALVARMPLMFGDAGPAAASILQHMIRQMQQGQEMPLFTDEFRTPASGRSAALGLLRLIGKACGILHLGGKDQVSRYQFGLLVQEVFDFPQAKLKPSRQSDVQMAAPRPPNVSLNSSKAFALGYNPLPLREELKYLKYLRNS